MLEITLPDKSKRKFDKPISVEDLAMDIGPGLAKATVAGRINGVLVDASEIIKKLPDLPKIMDRANDVMTLMAEGKFNPNTLAYQNLREEELKLELMRNKMISGILVLVIFILIVFK